jgi:hypothetical protein
LAAAAEFSLAKSGGVLTGAGTGISGENLGLAGLTTIGLYGLGVGVGLVVIGANVRIHYNPIN